jgi:hypothetical protein
MDAGRSASARGGHFGRRPQQATAFARELWLLGRSYVDRCCDPGDRRDARYQNEVRSQRTHPLYGWPSLSRRQGCHLLRRLYSSQPIRVNSACAPMRPICRVRAQASALARPKTELVPAAPKRSIVGIQKSPKGTIRPVSFPPFRPGLVRANRRPRPAPRRAWRQKRGGEIAPRY